MDENKNSRSKRITAWMRILLILSFSSFFIFLLVFAFIFSINSLIWIFKPEYFKDAIDIAISSFKPSFDFSLIIISFYLFLVFMFSANWLIRLTSYRKDRKKSSLIGLLKRNIKDENYLVTLKHIIEYRLDKDTEIIISIVATILLTLSYLFIAFLIFSLLLVLMTILQPGIIEEFTRWWGDILNKANLDVSNLAIVIFTLVLVWIEYRRYQLEFAHPRIDVTYLAYYQRELIFKIFVANVSRLSYIFEGSYFIPPEKEGVIWFKERDPRLPIELGQNMFEKIDKSMVGERTMFIQREQSKEYYFTLPVDSERMGGGFFVIFAFSYLHSKRIILPWEMIISYLGLPPQIRHNQFFVYFVNLEENKAKLVAQL